MTTITLYRKHKAGEISREKFLYEVRRDNNLPFITNLTSYDDAVKILKNKGIVTEVDTKEAKADEAVKAEVKAKAPSTKKPESLSIDVANPYEYRHGLQHELNELGEYTDEALEKAKTTVLKNLAKDANFYSNLLNQKQSPYEFKAPETDAPGMQAKADGYLKKELKKDEKANVKDSLNKSEAAKGKPKGVKEMPDKGVEGKEKVVKESVEEAKKLVSKEDKIAVIKEWIWYTCEEGTKTEDMDKYNKMVDIYFADKEDVTKDDFKKIWAKVTEKYGIGDVGADWEAFPETWKDVQTGTLVNETEKTIKESEDKVNESFKYFDNYEEFENTLFQLYPQVKANPEKYKKTWDSGEVSYSDGYVNWGSWYPDRPQSYSGLPPGAVNMNNKMSQSDLIYPAGSRMDEDQVEEGSFMGGVDLGSSFEKMKGGMNAEEEFETLMKRYDWYAEMSDDARKWDAQEAMKVELRKLSKSIGVDKAVEIFNRYAPSDRKVTSSNSMWGMNEDKHAKIKEALKKALKEVDPVLTKLSKDEETAEKNLATILKKKADILNKPGTQG